MITRRGVVSGLIGLLAAPAIVRTPGLLMPVRPVKAGPYEDAIAWILQELATMQATYRREQNMDYLPRYAEDWYGHAQTVQPGVWAGRQLRGGLILPFQSDNG